MENGYYRKRPIDWRSLEVDLFVPHLFDDGEGCGANCLSLLTGINPRNIKNTNWKNRHHWTDAFMVGFLKKRGFIVKPLTKCDVTNHRGLYTSEFITNKHIMLFSQLLGKNTASWSVVHNQLWYHNFQICSFNGLNTLNSPTLTCYVVCNPKWRSENWD